MDPISFGLMRHYNPPSVPQNVNVNLYGGPYFNYNTDAINLVATSSIYNFDTNVQSQYYRAVKVTNNYTTFEQVSIAGLNPDKEAIIYTSNTATEYGIFTSGTDSYYVQNQNKTDTMGAVSYTTDNATKTDIATPILPNLVTIYQANGTTADSYTDGSVVGIGGVIKRGSDWFVYQPLVTHSLNQLDYGSGSNRDVAMYEHFSIYHDATTNTSTLLRPTGWRIGLSIGNPLSKPVPLDFVEQTPAPEDMHTLDGTVTFPGIQRVPGKTVFYNAGAAVSITMNSGGTGINLHSSNSYGQCILIWMPPTSDINSLPVMISSYVDSSGSLNPFSTPQIWCAGAGFTGNISGPPDYIVSNQFSRWAQQMQQPGAAGSFADEVGTWTTPPDFSITIDTNQALIRYDFVNDYGSGYSWNNTNQSFSNIAFYEAQTDAQTRSFLNSAIANASAIPYTSATSGAGTMIAGTPVASIDQNYTNVGIQAQHLELDRATRLTVSKTDNLRFYQSSASITGIFMPGGYNQNSNCDDIFLKEASLQFTNDFQTFQWLEHPDLGVQAVVPHTSTSYQGTAVPAANSLVYTAVAESDAFVRIEGMTLTGVGTNMYVVCSKHYGDYATTEYKTKFEVWHLDIGTDQANIAANATWTKLWTSAEIVNSSYILTPYQGNQVWASIICNADVDGLATAATEMLIEVSQSNWQAGTNSTHRYGFTITGETTFTEISLPTVSYTSTSTVPAMFYDSINDRYMRVFNNSSGYFNTLPTQVGIVLFGVGESLFNTSPTLTFIGENTIGNVWQNY